MESWRPIVGYEDRYAISDHGNVRSFWGQGRILIPTLKGKRSPFYEAVTLSVNDLKASKCIHVLVAEAFLPPRPTPNHWVRHYDGNSRNNHVSNLRWGTPQDDADDRMRLGTVARGERHGMYGRHLFGMLAGRRA
ncbi:MAG: hypothetical protein EPO08_13865, partial [Rhodospirillaceae bacterium]